MVSSIDAANLGRQPTGRSNRHVATAVPGKGAESDESTVLLSPLDRHVVNAERLKELRSIED